MIIYNSDGSKKFNSIPEYEVDGASLPYGI
jgi:hypothetical protein